ncbi:MAG TPA: histidine phosphatase family protein [Acidimicrobiales bacterium]
MSDRPRPDVVLVRHGATEWTMTRRHTGTTDIPLTEEGRRQARRLGEVLARSGERFGRVLSSPLSRALDTCRLALAGAGGAVGSGFDIEVRDELREWDYGDYEGRTSADIRASAPGWLLWTDGVPGGETIDAIAERVDRVIADIRSGDGRAGGGAPGGAGGGPVAPAAGPVAVFAHGHLLRVFAARWLGQPPTLGAHLGLAPASLSRLGWEHGVPSIALWNERAHLTG